MVITGGEAHNVKFVEPEWTISKVGLDVNVEDIHNSIFGEPVLRVAGG